MKKILFTIMLGWLVTANAGNLWSTVQGMSWKEVKTNKYTINTAGLNPRVYEFVPQNAEDHLCIIVFPNSDGKDTAAVPTMQCFKNK